MEGCRKIDEGSDHPCGCLIFEADPDDPKNRNCIDCSHRKNFHPPTPSMGVDGDPDSSAALPVLPTRHQSVGLQDNDFNNLVHAHLGPHINFKASGGRGYSIPGAKAKAKITTAEAAFGEARAGRQRRPAAERFTVGQGRNAKSSKASNRLLELFVQEIILMGNGIWWHPTTAVGSRTPIDNLYLQPSLIFRGTQRGRTIAPTEQERDIMFRHGYVVDGNEVDGQPIHFTERTHSAITKRIRTLFANTFERLTTLKPSKHTLPQEYLDSLQVSDFVLLKKNRNNVFVAARQGPLSLERLKELVTPKKVSIKRQTIYLATVRRLPIVDGDSSDEDFQLPASPPSDRAAMKQRAESDSDSNPPTRSDNEEKQEDDADNGHVLDSDEEEARDLAIAKSLSIKQGNAERENSRFVGNAGPSTRSSESGSSSSRTYLSRSTTRTSTLRVNSPADSDDEDDFGISTDEFGISSLPRPPPPSRVTRSTSGSKRSRKSSSDATEVDDKARAKGKGKAPTKRTRLTTDTRPRLVSSDSRSIGLTSSMGSLGLGELSEDYGGETRDEAMSDSSEGIEIVEGTIAAVFGRARATLDKKRF